MKNILYTSSVYGFIIIESLDNGISVTYNPSFDGLNFTSSNHTNVKLKSHVSFVLVNKMFKLNKYCFINDVIKEAISDNEKIT